MASLLVASGPRAGMRVEVADGLEIGRSAGCAIRIHDDRASRVHARLLLRDEEVILEDLGSRNGTLLNEERATGHTALRPGDRIRIGRTYFVFEPRAQLLPARYSGGLLLLDDEIGVEEEESVSFGASRRRWEDELWAAARRLQAMPEVTQVAHVLSEEVVRLLRARGVAVVQTDAEATEISPLYLVGLPGISLPAALLRQVAETRRLLQVCIDRAPSRAAHDQEDRPATRARLLLAPILDARGLQGVIVAELAIEEPPPGNAVAVATLAALGGVALSGVARDARARLQIPFFARGIDPGSPILVGDSEALRETAREVLRVTGEGGVLRLLGEPGTGRTLLACLAHEHAPGIERPLALFAAGQARDAAARLFGSETSAEGEGRVRPGLLEQARGGSCVVRGFAGLPRELQLRLMEVIERGVGVREGGQRPVDLRLRLILVDDRGEGAPELSRSLTRRMKAAGVRTLEVPPLRARGLDVGSLFEVFLREAARASGRAAPPLPPELPRTLEARSWPGNLPELRALAEAALRETPPGAELVLPSLGTGLPIHPAGETLPARVAALEEQAIRAAMEVEGGKKSAVARRLGISRPTLDRKLRRYRL